jgi:hypothetical protein
MCFVAFELISQKLSPSVFATKATTYNFVVFASFVFPHIPKQKLSSYNSFAHDQTSYNKNIIVSPSLCAVYINTPFTFFRELEPNAFLYLLLVSNSLRCTTKDKKDLVFNGNSFCLIF